MILEEEMKDLVREVWRDYQEKYAFYQPVLGFIVAFGSGKKRIEVNVVPVSKLGDYGVWLNIKNEGWAGMACQDAQKILRRRISEVVKNIYCFKSPYDLAKSIMEGKLELARNDQIEVPAL